MATKKILFAISTILIFIAGVTAQAPVNLTGLKDSVTVRRDDRSIPYIEAANDTDVYFVQGYVTASDRLWQMDLFVDESLQYLSADLRSALESYSRGVNAYITTLDDKTLPVEFRILQYKPREWKPSDSVVVGKILADALSSTWRNDLLRASLKNLPAEVRKVRAVSSL